MKKLTLLLTAALALTACTAAPEPTPVPTATPAATEAPAEESAAAFPIGVLRMDDDSRRDTNTAYHTLFGDEDAAELAWLKLDYADGVETKVRMFPIFDEDSRYADWLITNDNVLRILFTNEDHAELRFKSYYPDGHVEEQTANQVVWPNFYDEYAAYEIWDTTCKRLDWQTGEITTWDAPISQIDQLLGAVGSKILLTRIVTDMPLPTDGEMYDAVIQSSQREFDLYDIATNTLEKLFIEPRYPEDGGSWKSYLGCRGDMLYFDRWRPDGDNTATVLLGYDLASGTWQEPYAEEATDCVGGFSSPRAFSIDGQLELVFLQSTPDTLHIYKIADGKMYNVPYHDPMVNEAYGTEENYGRPVAMTGDGQMLVTDGYVYQYVYPSDAYGLIDLDEYLAGSREYRKVQMWTE